MGRFRGEHFSRRVREGGALQEVKYVFRPHVSKLCFMADALTLLRIVAALVIFAAAMTGYNTDWVVAWFVVGELTDAFDGIFARTFLYPQDGKRRFWREYASEIDQVADILLGGMMTLYVLLNLDFYFGITALVIVLSVAIPVQGMRMAGIDVYKEIMLVRRGIYVLGVVAIGVFSLWQTTWFQGLSSDVQLAINYMIVVALCVLALFKLDRISEVKTLTPVAEMVHMKPRRIPPKPTPRGVPSLRHKVIRVHQLSPRERRKMMRSLGAHS